MKQVLTIAGSDSGGGAGIQADLKAFHANGAFGLSVITSVTAQNTVEVRQAYDLPADMVAAQMDAVFDDFDIAAVKTGMLSSSLIVETVVERLQAHGARNLVVDPVMISKSGYALLKPEAVLAVKKRLLPLATLVTPNLHEAELLAGRKVRTAQDAADVGREILDLGPQAVLVKGGHLEDPARSVDVLCTRIGQPKLFAADRIQTRTTHGTGCTFSAAIAAQLARGESLVEAIERAKGYVTEAIRFGLEIGKGHGPTNHFYFLPTDRQYGK